jgi:hypothetical protein
MELIICWVCQWHRTSAVLKLVGNETLSKVDLITRTLTKSALIFKNLQIFHHVLLKNRVNSKTINQWVSPMEMIKTSLQIQPRRFRCKWLVREPDLLLITEQGWQIVLTKNKEIGGMTLMEVRSSREISISRITTILKLVETDTSLPQPLATILLTLMTLDDSTK